MLAKMTAKNQLTLPKAVTEAAGATAYAGRAQYFVTGAADLLTLAPEFGPRIVTAAQLLETLA